MGRIKSMMRDPVVLLLICAHLMLAPLAASPSAAQIAAGGPRTEPAGEADDVTWTRLQFLARKLFFTATTRVDLAVEKSDAASASWIASPEGKVRTPAGPEVLRIELDSLFLGRRSVDRVWFDPADAGAFQRSKRRYGQKAYSKDYRHTGEGTFLHRVAPENDREAREGREAWSRVEDSFFPWDDPACDVVTEPATLFYLLSRVDFERVAVTRICVFSSKLLVPIEMRLDGRETVDEAGYVIRSNGREVRVDRAEALRIAVGPVENDGEFEFLGLEGDITVLVEVGRRLPFRIRGRLPHFGRVEVRLTEAELGEAEEPVRTPPDI